MKMDSNKSNNADSAEPDVSGRDFLSTAEAAKQLGVSYYTVYEYIREKRLVAEMVGGSYLIPKKAVAEFKAKPTGRTRDIQVQVKAGQLPRLVERFSRIREAQKHIFRGTMQRYIFEDEDDPTRIFISLIWKDTELPDESLLQEELAIFQHELADLLDWSTARYTRKRAIIHT